MTVVLTVVALVALTALTFGIVAALRLETPWLQPWAIVRAVVQLGLLTLVLGGVIRDLRWVAVFLVVMIGAATWIVVRRLALPVRRAPLIAGILVLSAAVPTAIVFGIGALDFTPRLVLALGGIVIGNGMTIATLMGRSVATGLLAQRDEIEGWLALGATPRRAAQRAVRAAASTAIIPTTDQTRATGIVTLPGSFVGAVFAGASVLQAAEFQLLVLAAILAAGAIIVALLTLYLGAPRTLPES